MGSAIMPIKQGVRDRASDFEGSVGTLHLEQALVAVWYAVKASSQ